MWDFIAEKCVERNSYTMVDNFNWHETDYMFDAVPP